MSGGRRDADDALVLDRYLDALLLSGGRGVPAPAGPDVDPELPGAARRLQRDLVRVHPSFRFEERLAARLAEVAHGVRAAAGAEGLLIPFRSRGQPDDRVDDEDSLLAAIAAGSIDPAADRRSPAASPMVLGGALTSAALSLAGVAWVAWRASQRSQRSGRDGRAMRRAARIAHRRSGRERRGRIARGLGLR